MHLLCLLPNIIHIHYLSIIKGKNITPQSVRTLLAGIPQFFGFVTKDENGVEEKYYTYEVDIIDWPPQ